MISTGSRRAMAVATLLTALLLGAVAPARAVTLERPAAPEVTGADQRITVQWAAVAEASGYRVELRAAGESTYSQPASGTCAGPIPAPTASCVIEGLTNGRTYVVRLIAVADTESEPSPDSAEVIPVAVPSDLPAPGLTADYRSIAVRWEPPARTGGAPVTSYSVWIASPARPRFVRATGCSGTLLDRRCTISGLSPATRYRVALRASNSAGTSELGAVAAASTRTPGDVTLAFGGDVHFTGAAAAQAGPGGLSSLPGIFKGADLSMVNLETALADSTASPVSKEFTFRASPRVLTTLARAGVDVVTMANNHGVDYGPTGLATTLRARAGSPVPIVGVGRTTDDAIKPWTTTVRGTRLAFFGIVGLDLAAEENEQIAATWPAKATGPGLAVWNPHAAQILSAVRQWRAKVDVVVVYVHWGEEMATCPNADQRRLAARLAAAGASVIVGAHPHVLQGAGWIGRSVVAHSLGNFAWYAYGGRPSAALIVRVSALRPVGYSWRPTTYTASGRPILVTGAEARATRALLAERSSVGCTRLGTTSAHGWLTGLTASCRPELTAAEQSVPEWE